MTTRSAFSGFVAAIKSGVDLYTSGPPQLVGLHNSFPGRTFGVWSDDKAHFGGLPIRNPLPADIEWRNEFFERCDNTGERLSGAAVHELPPSTGI